LPTKGENSDRDASSPAGAARTTGAVATARTRRVGLREGNVVAPCAARLAILAGAPRSTGSGGGRVKIALFEIDGRIHDCERDAGTAARAALAAGPATPARATTTSANTLGRRAASARHPEWFI
jgi:hypothetical protein